MAHRILLCEDEVQIVSFLQKELEREGYMVDAAFDGAEALRLFNDRSYDLVLLDIMLPVRNGLEVLREIRKAGVIPVLMLTARKEVYDKVAFFDAGADDYITKPFDTLELLARVRRTLNRPQSRDAGVVPSALVVDEPGCRVLLAGKILPLTKTEYDIFLFLYHHSGVVKTRDEILAAVYGSYYGESNNVDVNIKNIRKKIAAAAEDANSCVIETVRGRGYVLRCG